MPFIIAQHKGKAVSNPAKVLKNTQVCEGKAYK